MGFVNKEGFVVYPGYGVAKISREISKEINSIEIIFLELKFLNRDMTILVPRESFDSVGIRELSTFEEMKSVLDIFDYQFPEDWLQNICMISWNRRSKEYQNKIRIGKLFEIATIFRDLKFIEGKKGLSFGEKTVLGQVEFLLCEELSVLNNSCLDLTTREVRIFVESILKGFGEGAENFFSISLLNEKCKSL